MAKFYEIKNMGDFKQHCIFKKQFPIEAVEKIQ